jgi:hypothetical protein
MKRQDDPSVTVPDEERVEDAGLNYEEPAGPSGNKTIRNKKAASIA